MLKMTRHVYMSSHQAAKEGAWYCGLYVRRQIVLLFEEENYMLLCFPNIDILEEKSVMALLAVKY